MNYKLWFILSVIINILLILLIVYFYNVGNQAINDELECSIEVCKEYDTYVYDQYTRTCGCYLGEDLVQVQYMKNWGD